MIERVLEQLIIVRLGLVNSDLAITLFERDGALSTFYGNISLARALGLIDDPVKDDLDTVRRLRNAFAHSAVPITFSSEEVIREMDKLKFETYSDPQYAGDFQGLSGGKKKLSECYLAINVVLLRAMEKIAQQMELDVTAMRAYMEVFRGR
jgi:hypothetical protein